MDSFVFTGDLSAKEYKAIDSNPAIILYDCYYEDGWQKLFIHTEARDFIFDEGDLVEIPVKKEAPACEKSQLSLALP